MKNRITEFLKQRMVQLSLYSSLFVLLFAASNINWGGKNWEDILEADARGYYAYLPAVFIYQDLNFSFFEEIELKKYPNKNLFYDYRTTADASVINKYFCGTAIAELPFFLLGHILTLCSSNDADGYTRLYFVCISFGAIVYTWFAFLFIIRILRRFGIADPLIAFLIPVLIFGSNLYVYIVMDPGMSHIYSLAFFSMFVHYGMVFFENPSTRIIWIMALVTGIIILIRPSNALILFSLPFLAGSSSRLKAGWSFIKDRPFLFLSASFVACSIIFIQLLYYKAATGNFLVYSYSQEKFHLGNPHILDILFSYRRGFFLYTPVFFLSLAGFYFLYRTQPYRAVSLFLFLYLVVYVLSCWWIWWYGGGFSVRVFIEYFPFLMILLALLLQETKSYLPGKALKGLIVLLVIISQIQIYQYRHGHLHWENTDSEMYWDAFLRIDRLL